MRYFVVGSDGRRYGPANAVVLSQWFSEGRIDDRTVLESERTGHRVAVTSVLATGRMQVEVHSQPVHARSLSQARREPVYRTSVLVNTSGRGVRAVVPPGIRGWNWGAFLLSWIWAIGHDTWIGLLALVPYVGLIMSIMLGIKGNEWAWRNRRWRSVQHFRETQKVWTRWAVGLIVASLAFGISLGITLAMAGV